MNRRRLVHRSIPVLDRNVLQQVSNSQHRAWHERSWGAASDRNIHPDNSAYTYTDNSFRQCRDGELPRPAVYYDVRSRSIRSQPWPKG